MTRNRKADLQRKLSMAPVATPPPDLAARIKSEIPQNLRSASGTEPARSRAPMLRIAASIVLLASSLYLVLHLRSFSKTMRQPVTTVAAARDEAPVPMPTAALPITPPEPGSARRPERADTPSLPTTPPPDSVAEGVRGGLVGRIAEAKRTEAVGMTTGSPAYVDTVESQLAKKEQQTAAMNAAPSVVAQPAAASPAAVASAAPPPAAAAPVQAAESGGFAPERREAKTTVRDRALHDDAPAVRNFVAIQQAIAHGETLHPADTEAIVQHFAAPRSIPARLRVELEGSAAPLDATKWLLRVSVDGRVPAAARVELAFGDVVLSHRTLSGSPAPNETALYDIELSPNAAPDQMIASIRAGEAEARIRVADLRAWSTASTRMKRASLAAAWTHSLQSRTETSAIIAKAREAHIDDLADMVEQTERNP